jgi:hypothetical protein
MAQYYLTMHSAARVRVLPPRTFQYFWRCAHHPSAIENFFDVRTMCDRGCHAERLRWHHNGTHQLPGTWRVAQR